MSVKKVILFVYEENVVSLKVGKIRIKIDSFNDVYYIMNEFFEVCVFYFEVGRIYGFFDNFRGEYERINFFKLYLWIIK